MGPYARSLARHLLSLVGLGAAGGVLVVFGVEAAAGAGPLAGWEGPGRAACALLALEAPTRLALVLPAALLVAVAGVLGGAALRGEVIAAQACGAGPRRLLREPALVALGITALALVNQAWLAPEGRFQARALRWRTDVRPQRGCDAVGAAGERWLLGRWEAPRREATSCCVVVEDDAGEVLRWTTAARASWSDGGWRLERGRVHVRDGATWSTAEFAAWSAGEVPPGLPAGAALPASRPDDLRPPGRAREAWRASDLLARGDGQARAVLHARLALALAPLCLALALAPGLLTLDRGRRRHALGATVAAGAAVYLLAAVALITIPRGVPPWLLPWAPLVLAAALGARRASLKAG